jgi:hypothetical protein
LKITSSRADVVAQAVRVSASQALSSSPSGAKKKKKKRKEMNKTKNKKKYLKQKSWRHRSEHLLTSTWPLVQTLPC